MRQDLPKRLAAATIISVPDGVEDMAVPAHDYRKFSSDGGRMNEINMLNNRLGRYPQKLSERSQKQP